MSHLPVRFPVQDVYKFTQHQDDRRIIAGTMVSGELHQGDEIVVYPSKKKSTIDGALGMAYGISSNTFLIGIGASPAAASGAVHVAEIFTTAFSGVSHIKFGNVDKELFKKFFKIKIFEILSIVKSARTKINKYIFFLFVILIF